MRRISAAGGRKISVPFYDVTSVTVTTMMNQLTAKYAVQLNLLQYEMQRIAAEGRRKIRVMLCVAAQL
jgi:hypothetical protein